MNALCHAMYRSASAVVQRRFASTAAAAALKNPSVPPFCYKYSFQKAFLSDPSTHPILILMGGTLAFMTVMGLHGLATQKDLRIWPTKKHEVLRTWGKQHVDPWTARFARTPIVMHADEWKHIRQGEGLGVSHWEYKNHSPGYSLLHHEENFE